jgi:hypothetical protein
VMIPYPKCLCKSIVLEIIMLVVMLGRVMKYQDHTPFSKLFTKSTYTCVNLKALVRKLWEPLRIQLQQLNAAAFMN